MNSDKLIATIIKGSAVINSVRRINKSVNLIRILSYIFVAGLIAVNIPSVASILKEKA